MIHTQLHTTTTNNKMKLGVYNLLATLCFIQYNLISIAAAQGNNNGRLQRTTCSRGEVKVQRKLITDEFKNKYLQYNRRSFVASEDESKFNLPMPESNGCSTMGIKVGGEEDFTSCCDLHDVCYQTCGVTQQKCT